MSHLIKPSLYRARFIVQALSEDVFTILGKNPISETDSKVLYQGFVFSEVEIDDIMYHVGRYLWKAAHIWTHRDQNVTSQGYLSSIGSDEEEGDSMDYQDETDLDVESGNKTQDDNKNPLQFEFDEIKSQQIALKNTLTNLLRQGVLALNLLPENSVAGMVIVTDGCLAFPGIDGLDHMLSQIRTHQFSVSFLCAGLEGDNAFGDLFFVPHTDLMRYIATTTFGAYLESFSFLPDSKSSLPNWFQRAFYFWSFQRGSDGFNLYKIPEYLPPFLTRSTLIKNELCEATIKLSLRTLLSVRLREGFTITKVEIPKDNKEINLHLKMTWNHNVHIYYNIKSQWPQQEDQTLYVNIILESNYEFLHDLLCPTSSSLSSPFRLLLIRTFIKYFKSLRETEQLLRDLEKFSRNAAHWELPIPVNEGMPVFFIPPITTQEPELSTDDLKPYGVFTDFWKCICRMDINVWQKWLHTHRIRLLVDHDRPLPKALFIRPPGTSQGRGKLPIVQCRQALNLVTTFLREYTDFVLVEDVLILNLYVTKKLEFQNRTS